MGTSERAGTGNGQYPCIQMAFMFASGYGAYGLAMENLLGISLACSLRCVAALAQMMRLEESAGHT